MFGNDDEIPKICFSVSKQRLFWNYYIDENLTIPFTSPTSSKRSWLYQNKQKPSNFTPPVAKTKWATSKEKGQSQLHRITLACYFSLWALGADVLFSRSFWWEAISNQFWSDFHYFWRRCKIACVKTKRQSHRPIMFREIRKYTNSFIFS